MDAFFRDEARALGGVLAAAFSFAGLGVLTLLGIDLFGFESAKKSVVVVASPSGVASRFLGAAFFAVAFFALN